MILVFRGPQRFALALVLCLAPAPLGARSEPSPAAASTLPPSNESAALTQDPRGRLFAMLDHVNVVVEDLGRAADEWRRLGFSPVPGRRTGDGVANLHVGFPGGSDIELIPERASGDSLAADYVRLASEGSGGAYAALRVKDLAAVRDRFARAGFPAEFQASGPTPWMMFASGHPCRPLWFFEASAPGIEGTRSGRHANGAKRLVAVWIARERLDDTLGVALQIVAVPTRPDWDVESGSVLDLDGDTSIYVRQPEGPLPGRGIVGATVEVEDLEVARLVLSRHEVAFEERGDRRGRSVLVAPSAATGLWLELLEPARR